MFCLLVSYKIRIDNFISLIYTSHEKENKSNKVASKPCEPPSSFVNSSMAYLINVLYMVDLCILGTVPGGFLYHGHDHFNKHNDF